MFLYRSLIVPCSSVLILFVLSELFIQTWQKNIKWDSSSHNWLEFYRIYCGRVCKNGTLIVISLRCQRPSCFNCDCDSTCLIYGTCCPNADSTVDNVSQQNKSFEDPDKHVSSNLPSPERFVCDSFPGMQESTYFYMMSDCSPDYMKLLKQQKLHENSSISNSTTDFQSNAHITAQCEGTNTDSLDAVTPYLDLRYGITFKNKFCAICNGYSITNNNEHRNNTIISNVENIATAWTVEVVCHHFQNLYHVTTEIELFKSALQIGPRQCWIVYKQPSGLVKAKTCDPKENNVTESKCISSNLWLQNMCLNSKEKYLLVEGGQNIFCYICNGGKLYAYDYCFITFPEQNLNTGHMSPFSLLLGTTNIVPSVSIGDDLKCNISNERQTNKDECKTSVCSGGKIMRTDGLCKTAVKQIRGLGYKLFIVLTPTSLNKCVSMKDLKRINKRIKTNIDDISQITKLNITVTVLQRSHDTAVEEFIIQTVSLKAHFIAKSHYDRDLFENKILNFANRELVINLSGGNNSTLTFTPTILGTEFASLLDDSRNATVSEPFTKKTENNSCTLFNATTPNNLIFTAVKLYKTFIEQGYIQSTQLDFINSFIDVTHSLSCPFVSMNVTDMKYNENIATIMFSFNERNITVLSSSNISLVNGELLICEELFKNLTRIIPTPLNDFLVVFRCYLEYVLVIISVVFLLITVVTYYLFPTLRTLPGLNNMCLSLSLAVAQTMLLITAQFGVPGQLHHGYCLFHAIALHYAWLASFAWMNACCIHMYRVFTSKDTTYINTHSDTKRHIKYCLYAFGSPLIIIVILIVVCVWITNGTSIGYSDTFCFLDTQMSIVTTLLSLIAPLCCTILINGVLFFLTVREIAFVSSLVNNRRDGQSVITYAKLSTLTGLFYIVGGVALQINNPILDLLTSPLLCLQGVFIFMSFICNKRVGKLYSNLLECKRNSSTNSSSSKRTLDLHSGGATEEKNVRSDTASTSI